LPSNRSIAHLSFGPRVAMRLKRCLSENSFDLLHLHEPLIPSISLLALLLSRTANLATFHAAREGGSVGYHLARPLLRPLAGKVHVRAAVSPAAQDLVSRYFPGDYRIMPNGVDTDIFTPRGPTLGALREDGFYLLFMGRDEPRKGLDILLEALPLVREKHPEVSVLAAGMEKNTRDVEGVVWLGRLPDKEVPAAYRSARIMVSPALGWESFGIVLIEAMACGIPVVASDIPGYRAVVEDGLQGVLTPPGDARALAGALLELIEDRDRRERMAEAALERSADFSWDRLVEDVEAAYDTAVKRYKGVT
jgi:phosphatidyl-myo-inositol alpha-mannosyltransferase